MNFIKKFSFAFCGIALSVFFAADIFAFGSFYLLSLVSQNH